ncbi:MAG: DUF748 domain-containing protein [Steroidobacteraceae bacterium]
MTRRAWLIAGGVAALLLALYALAGFLWVPRLLQSSVLETFERDFGRKAEFARPRFNPFTLEFDAGRFSLPDADGTRLLDFERLYFDLELSSLWRRAWTFGAIRLERPYLKLVQRQDGSLNLADLQQQAAPAGRPRESKDPQMPSFAIGALTVTGGEIDVEDHMRAERFATTLRPVSFELVDFRSAGDGNAFSFSAGSDRAGRMAVDGTLGLGPLNSKGKIALSGLPATTVDAYLGDLLPVKLREGRFELRIAYEFSMAGQPFTLLLASPTVSARQLVTVARGYDVAWQIPALDITDTRVDLAARTVRVGAVELRDVVAPMWIDGQGFHAPGALPRVKASPAPEATVAALPARATPAWTIEAPDIRVAKAAIAFEDRRVKPAAALGLVVQELTIGALAMPQGGPLAIAGTVTADSGGELALQGTLEPDPLKLDAELRTTKLDLSALQPWLEQDTDLVLRRGQLSSTGRVQFAAKGRPRLRYSGDMTIAGLNIRDRALGEDLVNWSSLELRKLEVTQEPARLEIREIRAREPYLRLILAANGVTNIQSALDPEGARRLAAEIAAQRAGREQEKKTSRRGKRGKQAKTTGDSAEPPAAPRLPGRIGTIRIENANLNFTDYTLQPSFQIAVERLGGTITGMTSVATEHARVELAGEVDRYAPARIRGELNLLAAQSYMDLAAQFRNIELTSFNPYSSKFAGYRIDKGKLSIETKYRVENRMLDARHQFTLDQLQLGDRVESPDAVSLPLRLAVALLKDRNGVIDIDLPVTGSLDDPQFRLGPLIWKALLNLLGKIVTSPFALLGNLFGGGEDLSELPFAPGSAEIEADSAGKVAALRKALVERPGLSIDIPSTLDPRTDREALEQRRWILLVGGEAVAASPAASAQVAALRTNRPAYRDRLVELHRDLLGGRPDIPRAPEPAAGAAEVDPVEHAIAYLEPKLRATIAVDDAELAELAQSRAESVRDALLVDGTVDPARVFLIRGEPVAAAEGAVDMALTLK